MFVETNLHGKYWKNTILNAVHVILPKFNLNSQEMLQKLQNNVFMVVCELMLDGAAKHQ